MAHRNQIERLTHQHKESNGVIGIFGEDAKLHDWAVGKLAHQVMQHLAIEFPQLSFRHRIGIKKEEINKALNKIDPELGQTLFVPNASIIPDGGILEVKDDNGKWRIVLVSEAKHQENDIENIKKGVRVGKHNDQDLMAVGNAIERSHKNISEIANLMLSESYFPVCLISGRFKFSNRNDFRPKTRWTSRNISISFRYVESVGSSDFSKLWDAYQHEPVQKQIRPAQR